MPDVIPCLGCRYLRLPVATVKKHEDAEHAKLCMHPHVADVQIDWTTGKETIAFKPIHLARTGACGPDATLRTI